MGITRDAIVVLRIKPRDRAQWDTIKGKIRTFLTNNPQVTLDQPIRYEECDTGNT